MSITEEFGKTIRIHRKQQQLSQEVLAEKCGLHSTYIGQLERGEKSPTLETVSRLAEGLDVPVVTLFGELETVSQLTTEPMNELYWLVEQQTSERQEQILEIVKKVLAYH